MIRVVFTHPNRPDRIVEAADGISLMEAAKGANVEGIDADCGGCMVCGTCHVYVGKPWFDLLEAPSEMEAQILDCVPSPHPRARLSCQIKLTARLDGMSVELPDHQR
ncbi:2Fe-2S iron-sulfur cluster-binding protein [Sinimarinibacterium thermocellulolyticum]|uniref:2Fe-2S iron-sulfur cluster-binding protein n=1 Tax=Sinimarinibacterium thermocellulolyticum TaxID=3170016 RepID=A0ABV2AEI2_9GAMM